MTDNGAGGVGEGMPGGAPETVPDRASGATTALSGASGATSASPLASGSATRPPQAARYAAVFAVVTAGIAVVNLDLFIVNVALPSIGRSFHGTDLASLSWVLNAYAIVFAALLVPAGRAADLIAAGPLS